jgi:hypothetical protein
VEAAGGRTALRAAGEGVVAELVVERASLRIGEGFVGFRDVLEVVLGGLVARILVGMILDGELPVSLLDLLGARGLAHA